MADPTLELHDENGALIESNDNWKDTQQADIEATGLQPTKRPKETRDHRRSRRVPIPRSSPGRTILPESGWWKFIGCPRRTRNCWRVRQRRSSSSDVVAMADDLRSYEPHRHRLTQDTEIVRRYSRAETRERAGASLWVGGLRSCNAGQYGDSRSTPIAG